MVVFLSVLYALAVIIFPWEEISKAGFSDFEQYVSYFTYFYESNDISAVEIYGISTFKELFTHEVLWYEMIRWLTRETTDPVVALRVVSFFILFVWGYFLFKRTRFSIAVLFLFNPMVIDIAMSGIRNGLAWAVILIGISLDSKIIRAVLFFASMFIHSTSLVLVVFYYVALYASKNFRGRLLLFCGLGSGVLVGLALTVGNELVLGALGDRRTGASYLVGGGSFLQASIWAILLYFQCSSGQDYIRKNLFVIAILAWYQTMNPFIPWSYRVWGAILPLIAYSALQLPPRKRQLFLYLYIGYLVLQYIYWTKPLDL